MTRQANSNAQASSPMSSIPSKLTMLLIPSTIPIDAAETPGLANYIKEWSQMDTQDLSPPASVVKLMQQHM